jgi:hypothetical protein
MSDKIKIGPNGRVNIKWSVIPSEYSADKEKSIIASFAKKYSIPKANIKVEPVFIHKNKNGEDITIADGVIDNIQDPKFQHELFKQYIELNEIKDYDFNKILEIDSVINNNINYEVYDKHIKYSVKWIKWSNFMSYGPDNYFDFTSLKGLVLLTSEPANQGGKSTFCLDLLRFLLFGKVTSRESDWTLSKVFNKHLPEATEVSVEGCITIDSIDYVIKRTITRPTLKKRTEKSKVLQKVSYYRLVNDQYIDLEENEDLSETSNTTTNKSIKEAIGNERDFDLMICINSENLKDLISLKDTDRGRLISRWIGLLPLEEKDKIAREMYNQSVMPSLLTNRYDENELKEAVEQLIKDNEESVKTIKNLEAKEKASEDKITSFVSTKEKLLQAKTKVDETLLKVDVVTVENKIKNVVEKGKIKNAEKTQIEKQLEEVKDLAFNEEEYKALEAKCTQLSVDIAAMREQAKSYQKSIDTLTKGEYCPTCGAKLKDVDNSKAINEQREKFLSLVEEGKNKAAELQTETQKKEKLATIREQYQNKIKYQLMIDKITVDIANLRAKYKEYNRLLKDIQSNRETIEANNKIDIALNNISVNINTEKIVLKNLQKSIMDETTESQTRERKIAEYEQIIKVLNDEKLIIRNWKLYLEMVGKHGICKLVLRTVLPFINGELRHLLNDVCDFDVEVTIDDRNDVAFYLIHDNVKSNLASGSGFEQTVASLALRSVLNRISTFSKPSFVVFDEILGGVAADNYDQIKLLYDKIVTDFQMILEITHNKNIFDWHNQTILITKKENISYICQK